MKTALLRLSDKKEIKAEDAALRNERRAFCPKCHEVVNLHVKRKATGSPTHFEHEAESRMGKPCPRHYPRKVA